MTQRIKDQGLKDEEKVSSLAFRVSRNAFVAIRS